MDEIKLSIADSLKSGFQMWTKHFKKIMIVGLIVYIPTQLFIELAGLVLENQISLNDSFDQMRLANNIYSTIRYIFGAVALLGILNFTITQLEEEKEISIKEIITTGLNRWGKFIGVGIIAGLKIFVYTLMLIIPGIYKSVRLSFIDCVVATNNNKFKDEYDESEELVKNNWWRVFGFLVLMFFVQFLLEALFAVPALMIENSMFLSITTGVVVQLIETYFIVVRANYFFTLKQIKTEPLKEIESIAENKAADTASI